MVMKSYMHVRLAIVETHYHNVNVNIRNQDYWLLLFKIQNIYIKVVKHKRDVLYQNRTGESSYPHLPV